MDVLGVGVTTVRNNRTFGPEIVFFCVFDMNADSALNNGREILTFQALENIEFFGHILQISDLDIEINLL